MDELSWDASCNLESYKHFTSYIFNETHFNPYSSNVQKHLILQNTYVYTNKK
jgi:hypothetical protein